MKEMLSGLAAMSLKGKIIMVATIAALVAMFAAVQFGDVFGGSGSTAEDGDSTAVVNDVDLSDVQRSAIDDYDKTEKGVLARLENGLWSTSDESVAITFTDRTYTVSKGGKQETHTYAITAYTGETAGLEGTSSGTGFDVTMAIETDDGPGVAELYSYQTGNSGSTMLVFSPATEKPFVEYGAARTVKVEGGEEELVALLGQERYDKMVRDVQKTAAESYPTATRAIWSGKADIDWDKAELTTSYTLDNSSSSRIEEKVSIAG